MLLTKVAIDLFSGTGSATKAFQRSDKWQVFRVEKDPEKAAEYDAELQADVLELEPEDLPQPDFVWASPPCTDFSVAGIAKTWTKQNLPRRQSVADSVQLVYHTLWLIQELNPDFWFLENPRGMLRRIMPRPPTGQVTYCQYGMDYMKPTDLWGRHPASMEYHTCSPGDQCHISNSREANTFGDTTRATAVHGDNAAERARVPYKLSKAILKAVESPDRKIQQASLADVREKNGDDE